MNLLVQICSNTKDLYKTLYENETHDKILMIGGVTIDS